MNRSYRLLGDNILIRPVAPPHAPPDGGNDPECPCESCQMWRSRTTFEGVVVTTGPIVGGLPPGTILIARGAGREIGADKGLRIISLDDVLAIVTEAP